MASSDQYQYKDLVQMLYLCESTSEHPLAKAMVVHIENENPDLRKEMKYILKDFKNINGEGVVTNILRKSDK